MSRIGRALSALGEQEPAVVVHAPAARVAPKAISADAVNILYSEFRWQRRFMLCLVLLLVFAIPAMMWWMQSVNFKTASVNYPATVTATPTNATTGGTNGSSGGASTTGASTTTGAAGTNGAAGAAGARGTQGATGTSGVAGPAGPTGTNGVSTVVFANSPCMAGSCVSLQTNSPMTTETGGLNVSGQVAAASFSGSGAGLTNVNASALNSQPASYYLNASNIASGTLADQRLSGNVALLSSAPTFTGTVTAPSLHLATALDVPNGGTGRTTLAAGNLLIGNGTGAITSLAPGSSGQCLLAGTSGLSFASCPNTSLQAAFDDVATIGLPSITTSSTKPSVTIKAGAGLDATAKLETKNTSGATTFGVSLGTGATTLGAGSTAGQLTINPATASTTALVIQSATNQTADLLQAKDALGATVARVDAAGNAFFANSQSTGQASFNALAALGPITTLGNVGIGTATPLSARLQINTGTAVQVGQQITGAVGQIADLLQIQDANSNSLLRVDASGTLHVQTLRLVGNLTLGGHLISSGTAPVISTLMTGVVPLLTGTDAAGAITITTTIGATAGILAHVNFANNYSTAPHVVVSAATAAAASLPIYVNVTAGGFDIVTASVPANVGIYAYSYIIVQ